MGSVKHDALIGSEYTDIKRRLSIKKALTHRALFSAPLIQVKILIRIKGSDNSVAVTTHGKRGGLHHPRLLSTANYILVAKYNPQRYPFGLI